MPDLSGLVYLIMILLVTAVPLAIWKLIEIIIWIFQHVHIN
jgi:hypothetical protein